MKLPHRHKWKWLGGIHGGSYAEMDWRCVCGKTVRRRYWLDTKDEGVVRVPIRIRMTASIRLILDTLRHPLSPPVILLSSNELDEFVRIRHEGWKKGKTRLAQYQRGWNDQ